MAETFQAYRHLDREFRAVATCGQGHVGVHHVGYAFSDQRDGRRRVQRRCSVEDCGSCWSELALTGGSAALRGDQT